MIPLRGVLRRGKQIAPKLYINISLSYYISKTAI